MKAVLNRISSDLALISGRQTTKAGKSKPAGPGSKKQMAQRTRLSNVVSTYQLLSSFLGEAFESKPRNRNAYNMFMKENLNRSKVYLDKKEAGRKACVVAPYLISEGSLPSIDLCAAGDALVSSLRVPQGFEITKDTTSGQVAKALKLANDDLREGDVLFVVRPVQKGGLKGQPPVVEMKVYEFELDSSAGYGFYSSIPGDLFRVCGGFIGTAPNIESGGLAYVLSRTRGNKTLVSTQCVVLTPDNEVYKAYSSQERAERAAESYQRPHPPVPQRPHPRPLSEGEGSHAGSLESIPPGKSHRMAVTTPLSFGEGSGGEAVGGEAERVPNISTTKELTFNYCFRSREDAKEVYEVGIDYFRGGGCWGNTCVKLLLILNVFLILSCGDRNEYQTSISISEKDFLKQSLTGNVLDFDDLIMNPNQLIVYDTLLITCNQSTSNFFHLFNLKTKKKIGKSVSMGQGPMEMIQPYFIEDRGSISIYDMMTTVVSRYTIEEFISDSVPVPIQQSKLSERIFSKMAFLGDDIIGSPYNPKHPFYLFDTKGEKKGDFASYPVSGLTYSDPEIVEAYRADIVSDQKNRVAFCYNFTDLIEIYDKNGVLQKRLHGPARFFPHFKEYTDGVVITAKPVEEKYRAAFYSPVSVDDNFFVLFNGRNIRDKDFNMLATQIFVFDWDGNPKKIFFLDRGVSSIAVDQKNKKIYGISSQPEYCIVEYSYNE